MILTIFPFLPSVETGKLPAIPVLPGSNHWLLHSPRTMHPVGFQDGGKEEELCALNIGLDSYDAHLRKNLDDPQILVISHTLKRAKIITLRCLFF